MEQTSRAESARSKINDEEFQAYVAERRLKSAGTATTPSRDSLLMKRESSSKLRRANRLHGDAFDEIDKPCQVDDDEDGYDKETSRFCREYEFLPLPSHTDIGFRLARSPQ